MMRHASCLPTSMTSRRRISAASRGITGRLKIGAPEGVFTSPHLGMQKIIARLMKPDFDIFVDLVLGTPSELEQRLADGDRDIVLGPLTQKMDGIIYRPFYQEPHYLYCGKGHPLFIGGIPPSPGGDRSTRFSVRAIGSLMISFASVIRVPAASIMQMEAQLMMILSGHFIGFLPDHYADRWVKDGMMRAIKPRTYTFRSLHNIAYRKSDAERPVIRAFLECLPKTNIQ